MWTPRVWYHVLTTRLHPDATFSSFATATVDVAGRLFGENCDVQDAVICGWTCAGVHFTVPLLRKRSFVATPRRLPLEVCLEAAQPAGESPSNTNDNTNE